MAGTELAEEARRRRRRVIETARRGREWRFRYYFHSTFDN